MLQLTERLPVIVQATTGGFVSSVVPTFKVMAMEVVSLI
jgi:hypothetical protein